MKKSMHLSFTQHPSASCFFLHFLIPFLRALHPPSLSLLPLLSHCPFSPCVLRRIPGFWVLFYFSQLGGLCAIDSYSNSRCLLEKSKKRGCFIMLFEWYKRATVFKGEVDWARLPFLGAQSAGTFHHCKWQLARACASTVNLSVIKRI